MEPSTYLSGEKIDPLPLPDFDHDFKNYERYDIGAIGEFDVAILLEQYAGEALSKELYPKWRGGYYYAVRSRNDVESPIGLLYVSRWADLTSAEKFAEVYGASIKTRYRKAEQAPAQENKENLNFQTTWKTEEGDIVIARKGDLVLVSESLDSATTLKLAGDLLEPGHAAAHAAK